MNAVFWVLTVAVVVHLINVRAERRRTRRAERARARFLEVRE